MLAGSPESAGRGRSELESRVSAAGRAVYRPNAQGWMDIFAHTAGSYRCACRARLKLHGAVSFAAWGSLPSDHRACEVECEGWERPAQPHRRTCIHDAYHRRNTTGTVRNRAAPSRSRRNGVRCFAATDCSGCRQRIDKVWAAHLRLKVSVYKIRQNRRDFLAT